MSEEKTEKHLILDNLGRTIVTEAIEKVEPRLYGSITFHFKNGYFCNWKLEQRGEENKN